MASSSINSKDAFDQINLLDEKLSKRFISLDPSGYFLIKQDKFKKEIIVEHYTNDIDDQGKAIDPDTGIPLSCRGEKERVPKTIYKGRSAKEVGIKLTEGEAPFPLSRLDHALYLGRELQRAEQCLITNKEYIQD